MDEIRPDENGQVEEAELQVGDEGPAPEQVQELRKQGQEALDLGKNEKALDLYEEVIELTDGTEAEDFNRAGIALARLKRLEEAEGAFEAALDLDERFVPALSNLGNVYFARNELERAEEYYKKALRYDQEYATAYNNLAAVYKKRGKISEAVDAMKKSQRLGLRGERQSYYSEDESSSRSGARRLLGCFGGGVVALVAVVGALVILGVVL